MLSTGALQCVNSQSGLSISPRLCPVPLPTLTTLISPAASMCSFTPIKAIDDGSLGPLWLCDWHGHALRHQLYMSPSPASPLFPRRLPTLPRHSSPCARARSPHLKPLLTSIPPSPTLADATKPHKMSAHFTFVALDTSLIESLSGSLCFIGWIWLDSGFGLLRTYPFVPLCLSFHRSLR